MISDTKVSKITQKPLFYKAFTVWEHVIGEHTPSRLKESVARISGQDRFYHTVCAPAKKMLDMKYLSTSYDPLEMPTTYIVLK